MTPHHALSYEWDRCATTGDRLALLAAVGPALIPGQWFFDEPTLIWRNPVTRDRVRVPDGDAAWQLTDVRVRHGLSTADALRLVA